ncbi:hypothetical protein [Anoxybacteroides tepidamans]|uniref:hypothetical protein n=1 Tax=Anoxybacteroides tepidamans TaxID=265948 RepID=UPI000AC8A4B2|nr:hypothetical protein [Anoxybacillus tepidamans]
MKNFDSLNDRIIAEPSEEPKIVIKTNLDPKQITEENPYAPKKGRVTPAFESFFKGDEA